MALAQDASPTNDQVSEWKDRYRYFRPLPLLMPAIIFLLIPLMMMLNHRGLQNVSELFCWTGLVVLYVIFPVLDWLIGRDSDSPPTAAIAGLEASRFYRWTVWAFIPVQLAAVIAGAFLFVSTDLTFFGFQGSLSASAKLGIAITMGVIGGLGINVGHELAHRTDGFERWLAKAAFAPTCYGHFPIAHNRGHHIRVATPEDPSSARLGEPLWGFLPRTVSGSLRLAWSLEANRMAKHKRPVWHWSNEVIMGWAASIAFWTVPLLVFGPRLLPFIAIQALVGIALLESVNYIEHYGLLRQRTSSGRYARCAPEHSWNSDYLATNFLLLNLQRHSDHHANPVLRYQSLRSSPSAPQLPGGYALMMLTAWFPPIWRKIMDHRVIEHYGGDAQQANVEPRRRLKTP
jgi:alkane 1-monooxygenase